MLLLPVQLDCERSSVSEDNCLGLFSRYQFTSASASNKKVRRACHFLSTAQ